MSLIILNSNVLDKADSIIKEVYLSEFIPSKKFVRILIKALLQVFETWHTWWMVVADYSFNTETRLISNLETIYKLLLQQVSIDFSFSGWLNHLWNVIEFFKPTTINQINPLHNSPASILCITHLHYYEPPNNQQNTLQIPKH